MLEYAYIINAKFSYQFTCVFVGGQGLWPSLELFQVLERSPFSLHAARDASHQAFETDVTGGTFQNLEPKEAPRFLTHLRHQKQPDTK